MQANRFDQAIVRRPSNSCVRGLRAVDTGSPDLDRFRAQHEAYIQALRSAGLRVQIEPKSEEFPDSVFVEDAALCLPEGAILLRPGAPTRQGEVALLQPTLEEVYGRPPLQLGEGFVEGGDVMLTDDAVIIGLSERTDPVGAEALAKILKAWGYEVRLGQTPSGVLHFKTHSSYLGEGRVLCTALLSTAEVFSGYEVIETAPGEDAAANALRINDRVLLAEGFPQTQDRLQKAGFAVVPIPMSEAAKLDGGLSCLSLRFRRGT